MKLSYEELRESVQHHKIGIERKLRPIDTLVRESIKTTGTALYKIKPYTLDIVISPTVQEYYKHLLLDLYTNLSTLSYLVYCNAVNGVDAFLDRYQETIEEFGNGPISVEYPDGWIETFNEQNEEVDELEYHSRVKDVINHDGDDWYVANIKAFEDEGSEAEYTIWFEIEQLYAAEDEDSEHTIEPTPMIRDTYGADSLTEVSQIVQRMMDENDKETIQQKLAEAEGKGII